MYALLDSFLKRSSLAAEKSNPQPSTLTHAIEVINNHPCPLLREVMTRVDAMAVLLGIVTEKLTHISSLKSIARGVFWDCPSLEEVRIPAGVSAIGEYAFFYCTNLKHVYNYAHEPQPVSVIFKTQDITIHVPATSVEKYRNAQHWRNMMIVGDL